MFLPYGVLSLQCKALQIGNPKSHSRVGNRNETQGFAEREREKSLNSHSLQMDSREENVPPPFSQKSFTLDWERIIACVRVYAYILGIILSLPILFLFIKRSLILNPRKNVFFFWFRSVLSHSFDVVAVVKQPVRHTGVVSAEVLAGSGARWVGAP